MGMPYCPNPHDWSRYGLNQIAAMLRRHSPEAGPAAVTMWSAIETLCREQATRLRKALQDLEAQWPPTQEASLAFQEWGLTLVLAMENTAEVAHQNRSAAANISTEIERARARVETLMSEQARYQDLEQSGGTLLADAAYFGNELLEGNFDWRTWRAGLDRDAREIIADLEQKIYNYALTIYADPPYKPPVKGGIYDVEPYHGDGPAETASAGWGGNGFVPSVGSGVWAPPSGFPTPGAGADPAEAHTAPGGNTVLNGVVPGAGGGVTSPLTGDPSAGGAFVDTPWGRVLAPGGVIGSPAAGGVGVGTTPGGPGSVTSPVTGGPTPTGSATRTPGGPGMVPFVPPVMPGRPASNTASTSSGRRNRPGLPSVFETPEGPPGVIQPPAEPAHHDPGPGVIGIDR
jgi:hypothetical protein